MHFMLHLQLDNQSGVAAYRQIMEQIKFYAASGALPRGAKLPSIRELAKQLAVNPTTIVKAYTELQHDGVIEMKQGKGAFIAEALPALDAHQRRETLRPLARRLAVEASQLGAEASELVALIEEELGRLRHD
jgi:GntR family transcriptional regulator